ncbi:hypothetical protein [Polyangium aurulentum]|uniref:hypothetical protein n=1 Tax=Polyangium aurulentum TaxID=2567896 RepID=UPI0010AE340E|nr:hypothetical protein [Polyangium aurulentum]UQA56240.1 hypothetical protein E8A73_033725 [Polyangium aurulentum]
MGQSEQFAKRTFAEETAGVTHGAAVWQDPPEMGLVKVQGDGLLIVKRPEGLRPLASPWPFACGHDEVLIELKMPGDHLDVRTLQRALLRRQARQVQRVEDEDPDWLGEQPLWMVAPHVPEVLRRVRKLKQRAPGCYQIGPSAFPFVWVAANELPLRDELVPFLVARSGRALDEFARWVAPRRPVNWVLDMVQFTTMDPITQEEILRYGATDEPEVEARRLRMLQILMRIDPNVRAEVYKFGRALAARDNLLRVLARRGFSIGPDDQTRIDACEDVTTLERWIEQAVTAASIAEALA